MGIGQSAPNWMRADAIRLLIKAARGNGLRTAESLEKAGREANRLEECRKKSLIVSCNRQHYWRIEKHCRSRICPECSKAYGVKVQRRMEDIISVLGSSRRKNYLFGFLTLTVTSKRYSGQLPGHYDMKRAGIEVAKFIRLHYGATYARLSPSGSVWSTRNAKGAGAIVVQEVGKSGNLHFHAITYGPYIPQKRLAADWLEITTDSKVVDIRAARSLADAKRYITKYITKPYQSHNIMHVASYAIALKGLRRFKTYGIAFGVKDRAKPERHYCCPVCERQLVVTFFTGSLDQVMLYWRAAEDRREFDVALAEERRKLEAA